MPRKLRLEYPGAIYHVMNRGDRREPIFRGEAGRELFLRTLGEACAKTGWQVHVDCLMRSHFHLVDCVHLNPVRAKLLAPEPRLAENQWSSWPECLKSPGKRGADSRRRRRYTANSRSRTGEIAVAHEPDAGTTDQTELALGLPQQAAGRGQEGWARAGAERLHAH